MKMIDAVTFCLSVTVKSKRCVTAFFSSATAALGQRQGFTCTQKCLTAGRTNEASEMRMFVCALQ
jgi:hypothetical protein